MSNTTPEGKKTSITAEEILNKYGFIDGYSIHSNTEDSRKNLLAAIEYALTSSDKDAEIANLKKELDIETDSAIKWQLDHCRLAEQYEWLQRQIADASEKAHGSSGMCCQLRYNEKHLRESCEKALEEREGAYKNLETVRWTELTATTRIIESLESEKKALVEALTELKEVHNWLWENCDRGNITHTDMFNINVNAQANAAAALSTIKTKDNEQV